jgi:DNA processing protein
VGSRAATGYGGHVAGEIAADLAERGWTIVSGGAWATKDQRRATTLSC